MNLDHNPVKIVDVKGDGTFKVNSEESFGRYEVILKDKAGKKLDSTFFKIDSGHQYFDLTLEACKTTGKPGV